MIWIIIGCLVLIIIAFIIYDNIRIQFTIYEEKTSFSLTVCQISDLHSKKINIKKLLRMIDKINPDCIFYTGDMVDGINDDLNISLNLIKSLMKYKSFYVLGNHELRLEDKLDEYLSNLRQLGVVILRNEIINYKGALIKGEEPILKGDYSHIDDRYSDIILAHNPEWLLKYNGAYIFSGHTHGGQFRLFGKGLYAPDQGILPKYSKGYYENKNKKMFISAGLGGKDFKLRLFNPPHINVVRFVNKST